jgi:hypothetical protein
MATTFSAANVGTFPEIKTFDVTAGDATPTAVKHGYGKKVKAWISPIGASVTAVITAIDSTSVTVQVSSGGAATLFICPETA